MKNLKENLKYMEHKMKTYNIFIKSSRSEKKWERNDTQNGSDQKFPKII